ncbi:MAG: hypothetical protein NZ602_11690 [Thermoguttaceae bacterium]|nr:hypothetical protein [Thermoguttaceae bacterium]MDW8039162.1 hypothetical protein [Thermoguttaceae bacterium]
MKRLVWAMVAGSIFLVGCVDSIKPLVDPQKAKPDKQLVGLWRQVRPDGEVSFYHIGQPGDEWPEGVFRVVVLTHREGRLEPPAEILLFPTQVAGRSYLNIAELKPGLLELIKEKGWEAVQGYFIWRYQIEGDRLTVWAMDNNAKRRAIETGKLKGEITSGQFQVAKFTDTPENLARFLSEAGDSLFSNEPVRLERLSLSGR